MIEFQSKRKQLTDLDGSKYQIGQIDRPLFQEYFNSLFHIQTIMQAKTQSRAKLPQYSSLKEFESVQEASKKLTKAQNTKSNKKIKHNKSSNHSHSKGKPSAKPRKNNQNFNSINILHNDTNKIKSTYHETENSKRHNRPEDKLKRNSSEKLIKTKSVSRIQLKSERRAVSPSPIGNQQAQHHQQQKPKQTKNVTSRSERQKKSTQRSKQDQHNLKKSASKSNIIQKSQHNQRSNRNRVSIKTQMSSKTHSVIKQQVKTKNTGKQKTKNGAWKQIKSERNKPYKMPKPSQQKLSQIVQRSILYSQVSFQQQNGDNPCESAYIGNQRYFLPYPQTKTVKTEGCQIENRSQYGFSLIKPEMIKAAIKIQRTFRGYITRKYIDEAKYIISKVKVIQSWWRKILQMRKEKLNQKIVSVSNSLITIKDFNDTFKTDRHKLFSESKENTLSNNKINFKEFMRNILQQNQSQKGSNSAQEEKEDHSIDLSKDKNTSREHYIQLKLQDQIKSQRKFNFNSPRSLGSPNSARTPTNMLNIKQMFHSAGGSNEKQRIKQLLQSPRITSPQQLRNTPQKIVSEEIVAESSAPPAKTTETIEPFNTTFLVIEEFSLLTVNYFRDRPMEMKAFIQKLEALKQFRTNIILKTWNSHTLCYEQEEELDQTLPADYEYLEPFQRPILFDRRVREEIIRYPEIEMDLLDKRFQVDSSISGPIHRIFLQFMFDALEQAYYEQHKSTIIAYGRSLNRYIFENQQSLFENYLASALDVLCKWEQCFCGMLADSGDQELVRELRLKETLRKIQPWDMGQSHRVAIKLQASQKILLDLLQQVQLQLLRSI